MRILIDASPLLLHSAGVKTFVYYWLTHLKQESARDHISTFPFRRRLGRLDHEKSTAGWLATKAGLELLGLVNIRENGLMDLLVNGRYDLFHASQQMRNPPSKCRLTATVYDMTCWLMPEMHTPANVAATKQYADRVLRRAHGLIAISECTRNDAVRILGLREDAIKVIYPGVSESFFGVSPSDVETTRGKYGLTRRYLLFVGCIEPRKNLAGMLDAWEMLPESLRDDCEFVVAGPLGWENGEMRARLTAGLKGVRYLGYVPEDDLPAAMAGATGFVYPSHYEGFGFPVAQAMAVGTPVITSTASCLPEIVGDAALCVNPRNAGEISEAMRQVLSSDSLWRQMRERGLQRAERFRWSDCARQSLEFFHQVANGN